MYKQLIIRVSKPFQKVAIRPGYRIQDKAEQIAKFAELLWKVDGSNLTSCLGRWKDEVEEGINIEIVVPADEVTHLTIAALRDKVVSLGLTAFVTIATVQTEELY